MKSPIIDKEMKNSDWKKIDAKLLKKANSANSTIIKKDNTYFGLERIKEKKDLSIFWKFFLILITLGLIVIVTWILLGILSGRIDVFGIYKNLINK